jgi:hypothetical protein
METPKNLLNADQKKLLEAKKNMASTSTGMGKLVTAFLIGAVVGAFGMWLSKGDNQKVVVTEDMDSAEMLESATSTPATMGVDTAKTEEVTKEVVTAPTPKVRKEPVSVSGTNAIAANDQKAGTTAEVTMVTLSVPGWVAIHEDKNGELGNVLGAARFEPGIHLGEVELLRGTVAGAKYHAVLYEDTGSRGFDTSEDAPIKNDKGLIEATFTTN